MSTYDSRRWRVRPNPKFVAALILTCAVLGDRSGVHAQSNFRNEVNAGVGGARGKSFLWIARTNPDRVWFGAGVNTDARVIVEGNFVWYLNGDIGAKLFEVDGLQLHEHDVCRLSVFPAEIEKTNTGGICSTSIAPDQPGPSKATRLKLTTKLQVDQGSVRRLGDGQ